MSRYSDSRLSVQRRAFVMGSLFWAATPAIALAKSLKSEAPTILFVCQAGTAKSAIAREVFKKRAKEQGIAAQVFSRGLVIEDHLSSQLKQWLRHDGIDTASELAKPLTPADWARTDILVYFNPLPLSVSHKDIRDWSDLPSVNDDYVNARTVLNQRIDALLAEIALTKQKR